MSWQLQFARVKKKKQTKLVDDDGGGWLKDVGEKNIKKRNNDGYITSQSLSLIAT